jgi:hypothetical protein
LIRTNTELNKKLFSLFLAGIVLVAASCLKLKGEFAFRYDLNDSYRRMKRNVEFSSDKIVHWMYSFNPEVSNRIIIGSILQKKELVWVDVKTDTGYIDSENHVVYGEFENLPPGSYRLVITDVAKKTLIDEVYFSMYDDDEDSDG